MQQQQKAVLRLELHDDRIKKKAFETVAGFPGVESIAIDMKDNKLTVIGDIDSVIIAKKLRKICHTTILTVGPAKEPEKKPKPEEKPEQPKPEIVYFPNPNYYCWSCQMFGGKPYCMCCTC